MSFFLDNWTLFAIAIASGGMLLWPALGGAARGGGLNPNEVVQLMNREKAQVIDVCSADEFAAGHIPGALNVPLFSNEERAEIGTAYKHEGRSRAVSCRRCCRRQASMWA